MPLHTHVLFNQTQKQLTLKNYMGNNVTPKDIFKIFFQRNLGFGLALIIKM